MAKGSIATAWIQILPSLEGLQSALVKASKGSTISPKIQPAASSTSMFKSSGSKLGGLFSAQFGKSTQSGMSGAFGRIASNLTGSMGGFGSRSGSMFAKGFSGYIGAEGIGTYLRLGAAGAAVAVLGNQFKSVLGTITSIGDEWAKTSSRLELVTGNTKDYSKSLKDSLGAANEIGVGVSDLVDSSSRLVMLAPKTIPDYKTALKFTTLLNENMISTGASTEEAASATRQITQALGKGVVNGDELNSIMENSPQIAQMLAKHLNVSTGELKEMGKQGKISGDALRDAVLENAAQINEQFKKMPVTAERSISILKNDWLIGISDMAEAMSVRLGEAMKSLDTSGVLSAFAESMNGLSPIIDGVADVFENFVFTMAPLFKSLFDPGKVVGFLTPLREGLDYLAHLDFNQIVDAFKLMGVFGGIAFSGILGGSSQLLNRIPLLGKSFNTVKNIVKGVGNAVGAAMGESVSAVGSLISKLGKGVEALSALPKGFGRMQKSVATFNKGIEDMDFDKMPKKFNEALGQVASGTGDMEKNFQHLQSVIGKLSNTAKEELPAGFEKALTKLQADMEKPGDSLYESLQKAKTAITDTAGMLGKIGERSKTISLKMQVEEPNVDIEGIRASIGKAFGKMTGIRIPDFLTPAVGTMVATMSNRLTAIPTIVTNVFTKSTTKIHGLFDKAFNAIPQSFRAKTKNLGRLLMEPLEGINFGGVAKKLGSGFDGAINSIKTKASGLSAAFTDKFPRIGAAGRSALAIVGDTSDRVKKKFGTLKNSGIQAMSAIASMSIKAAGKGLQGVGKAVSLVGKGFAGLGRMATSLGITGALMTGVTAGFTQLLKANPSQMAGQMTAMFDGLNAKITNFSKQVPEMAKAFSQVAPQIMASLSTLLPSLIGAVANAATTIATTIATMAPGLIQGFQVAFQALADTMPTLIPALLGGLNALIGALMDALPGMMIQLTNTFLDALKTIGTQLPSLLGTLMSGFSSLMSQLAAAMPDFAQQLATAVPQLVNGIVTGLIDNLPMLIDGVTALVTGLIGMLPTLLPVIIQGAVDLVNGLVAQLPTIITSLVAAIPQIIDQLVAALVVAIPALVNGAIELMNGIVAALPQIISALIAALPTIIDSIVNGLITALPVLIDGFIDLFIGVVNALPQIISALIDAAPMIIEKLGSAVLENFPKLIQAFGNGVLKLAAALPGLFLSVVSAIPKIVVSIAKGFADIGGKIISHFKDIPGMIKGVFSNAGSWLMNAGKAILDGFLRGLKNAWKGVTDFIGGIGDWIVKHKGPISYDRVMLMPAGKAIMQGLGKGLDKGFKDFVEDSIYDVNDAIQGIGDDAAWLNGGTLSMKSDLGGVNGVALKTQGPRQVTNNFPAKIVRNDEDLYTAYPIIYRSAMAELGA